jgi:PAS domain S-box-containing protein
VKSPRPDIRPPGRAESNIDLRESEALNLSLMNASPDCVKVLDLDGRVLHMNTPGICAMEIDDFATVQGKLWADLWPGEARADIECALARAINGEPSSFQAFCATNKGTPKWWDVTVSPVRGAGGGPAVQVLSVSRDVTKRREEQDRLRDSEAGFRSAFEQSAVGMAQVSVKTGKYIRVNPKFCAMTGYSAEELACLTPMQLTFVRDRDEDSMLSEPVLRGEMAVYDREKRYQRKDGKIIWVHTNATLLRDADGKPDRTMAVIQEITVRKEAEAERDRLHQQLEDERWRLADMFRQAPAFICSLRGSNHVFEMANDAYARLVGRQDFLGLPVREALPEVEGQGFFELLDGVFQTGKPYIGSGARFLINRASSEAPVELFVDFIYEARRNPAGDIVGVAALGIDVTERHHAQELQRLSDVRYRRLFDALDAGYCVVEMVWDEAGKPVDYRFLEANAAFKMHTGLEGAIGQTIRTLVPAIEQHWMDAYGRVAQTGVACRFVDQAQAMAGRWFEVYAHRLDDFEGGRVAILFNNVSEKIKAEQALRESEERLRVAAEAVSDVVWTNDAAGLMQGEQRGWGRFTGQSPAEYQGTGWSVAIHPEDTEPTLDAWKVAVREKCIFHFQHRVRRYDGEWRLCTVRALPVLDPQGTIREWVGVHADITEQKRDEEKLRQLAADLSQSDHRKDEFLATLAHELRNPLAPLRNGLQLLKMAGGQQATIEPVRFMMERQLTQMVRLVDDLMDVSRINQNKLELRKARITLASVLNSAVETSRPLIETMDHELILTLPRQALMVDADMTRLAQVFLNLLNNAAKYSDRSGRIELKVELQDTDAVVTVKDNGIGIAADQLPHIFGMFTQVDKSLEKSQGGLGIGLTLVKRLVEMHGGSVEARSEGPGRGSEFVVRLPAVLEHPHPDLPGGADEAGATMSALRILVVDDNRDGADSLTEMLNLMGNDTRTAYDGQQGVDMAAAYQPDVILLDIGLPKLNGYEACRIIRQQAGGKEVILIAVTGWGQEKDRERTLEAGFDHHLVKPVNPQALMTMLTDITPDRHKGGF